MRRFICALLILGTQIFLPVTPALADESQTVQQPVLSEGDASSDIEIHSMDATEESSMISNDTELESNNGQEEKEVEGVVTVTDEFVSNPDVESDAADTTEDGSDTDTVPENAPEDPNPAPTFVAVEVEEQGTTTGIYDVPQRDDASQSQDIAVDDTDSPSATVTPVNGVPLDDHEATTTDEVLEDVIAEDLNIDTEPTLPYIDTEIDEASTTPVVDVSESTVSSTTPEVGPSPVEIHTFSADGMHSFNPNECARVADGSFYCVEEKQVAIMHSDGVFAGPDKDGDSEIFMTREGESTQLTFNQEEDAAPYYDGLSKTVVFHRLIGARYQIVSLDLETNEEEVLTHDSYNNMQPTRHGDLVVWQGWVGNDWEVFLQEGDEIQMLTDNGTHDIGPYLSGEYVIWQSDNGNGWSVMVYDIATKMMRSVDESDGASIENPRLVLVYDAKHENGDVETRGYDLNSEKSVSLSADAPALPSELPEPEQTGEERALITTVTQIKSKTAEDDGEPDEVPLVPDSDQTSATTTNSGTLIIPPLSSTTPNTTQNDLVESNSAHSSSTPDLSSEETFFDLIIPPQDEEIVSIPDLVIPEFSAPQTDSDSQVTVAETE